MITKLRSITRTGLLLLSTACNTFVAPQENPDDTPLVPPVGTPLNMSQVASTYLNSVIAVMQANSMNRNKIDWPALRNQAFGAVSTAQTITDTYPGIQSALKNLADGHSSYRGADGTLLFVSTRTCIGNGLGSPVMPPNVGYVKVGAFSGTSAQGVAFATGIQNAIRDADRDSLAGWIVDLRGNAGGNMWPMIAGLGPILGDGVLGWFIDPAGSEIPWEYRNGASYSNNVAITRVAIPYVLKNPNPRVAVLVDNLVASSGEATFIAFRKRANARSFGVATCGLSTANSGFQLSDGGLLNLTVSVMADRSKTLYGDQIQPDERIAFESPMFDRALAWLKTGN